jgi:hypothetical protein
MHLAIVDTNSGADLTLQTNTVIVGQQMNLKCQLSVTNVTFTNFSWTIPGQTVKRYDQLAVVDVTNTYTVMENLTNSDLASNSIAFYWINGGTNLEVDCSAMVNGKPVNGRAYFNVNRPAGTLITVTTTNIPPVNIITNDDGSLALQYGTFTNVAGQAGISEFFSVTTPTNGAGSFAYIQIIDLTTVEWTLDGDTNNTPHGINGTNILDAIPYLYQYGLTSIGNSDTQSNRFYDYPGASLAGDNHVSSSDQFSGYLMYRPAGDTNSTIWVTLQKVQWSWSGAATKGTNGVWTLDTGYPNPPINPAGTNSTTLPTWYGAPPHGLTSY